MKKMIRTIMVLSALVWTGCTNDASLREYGFADSGPDDTQISYKCGYILPQTEFEKDNVFLDVYYGAVDGFYPGNDVVIRLYFCQAESSYPWYEDAYLVKELSGEESLSDKYIWKGKEGYHERMVIPEELFGGQEGSIAFIMADYREPTDESDDGFGSLQSFSVNFYTENDIVILSVTTE